MGDSNLLGALKQLRDEYLPEVTIGYGEGLDRYREITPETAVVGSEAYSVLDRMSRALREEDGQSPASRRQIASIAVSAWAGGSGSPTSSSTAASTTWPPLSFSATTESVTAFSSPVGSGLPPPRRSPPPRPTSAIPASIGSALSSSSLSTSTNLGLPNSQQYGAGNGTMRVPGLSLLPVPSSLPPRPISGPFLAPHASTLAAKVVEATRAANVASVTSLPWSQLDDIIAAAAAAAAAAAPNTLGDSAASKKSADARQRQTASHDGVQQDGIPAALASASSSPSTLISSSSLSPSSRSLVDASERRRESTLSYLRHAEEERGQSNGRSEMEKLQTHEDRDDMEDVGIEESSTSLSPSSSSSFSSSSSSSSAAGYATQAAEIEREEGFSHDNSAPLRNTNRSSSSSQRRQREGGGAAAANSVGFGSTSARFPPVLQTTKKMVAGATFSGPLHRRGGGRTPSQQQEQHGVSVPSMAAGESDDGGRETLLSMVTPHAVGGVTRSASVGEQARSLSPRGGLVYSARSNSSRSGSGARLRRKGHEEEEAEAESHNALAGDKREGKPVPAFLQSKEATIRALGLEDVIHTTARAVQSGRYSSDTTSNSNAVNGMIATTSTSSPSTAAPRDGRAIFWADAASPSFAPTSAFDMDAVADKSVFHSLLQPPTSMDARGNRHQHGGQEGGTLISSIPSSASSVSSPQFASRSFISSMSDASSPSSSASSSVYPTASAGLLSASTAQFNASPFAPTAPLSAPFTMPTKSPPSTKAAAAPASNPLWSTIPQVRELVHDLVSRSENIGKSPLLQHLAAETWKQLQTALEEKREKEAVQQSGEGEGSAANLQQMGSTNASQSQAEHQGIALPPNSSSSSPVSTLSKEESKRLLQRSSFYPLVGDEDITVGTIGDSSAAAEASASSRSHSHLNELVKLRSGLQFAETPYVTACNISHGKVVLDTDDKHHHQQRVWPELLVSAKSQLNSSPYSTLSSSVSATAAAAPWQILERARSPPSRSPSAPSSYANTAMLTAASAIEDAEGHILPASEVALLHLKFKTESPTASSSSSLLRQPNSARSATPSSRIPLPSAVAAPPPLPPLLLR